DIARDIAQASKLLYDENNAAQVSILKEKSLDDFLEFKQRLFQKRKKLTAEISAIANETLQLISKSGLEESDFSSGYLPKHFNNLANGRFNINFENKWQTTLGEVPLYPKRVSAATAGVIDELVPVFVTNFQE